MAEESQKFRALLIEDNDADYVAIKGFLGSIPRSNIVLDRVATSDQGLSLMCSNQYDVYLLDYRLGGDDGLDLLQKAVSSGCKKPVIFLTGYDQYDVDVEAMNRGAFDFLVKNKIDPPSLERSIRYAIERWRVQESLVCSLRDKEVLLKEIHHRVKNNLQIISSLLKLQKRGIQSDEARKTLEECYDRVRSIALVHEKLYQSHEVASINFTEYLETLISGLFRSYGIDPKQISLEIQAQDVVLSLDAAIPCGLIVNELASNALKHAFPNQRPGKLLISFLRNPSNELELRVADNGVGIPADFDISRSNSLGLELVHTLAAQLGGTVAIDGKSGTEFKICFREMDH
jgi:two-component sensor histidine kinase